MTVIKTTLGIETLKYRSVCPSSFLDLIDIQVKATANLGRAAIKGDLATVQDCLSKGADPDGRHKKVHGFSSFYI